MRVLLTTRALAQPGGSETYLVTVARELRALGHELTIYSPELGAIAQRLRAEGFEVLDSLDGCPLPDVAHVQHATTAFRVRGRFPELPMVFVSHSSIYDIENVPALASPQAVVVLSDVVGRRVRAGAWADTGTVVRLRQPIVTPHDDPALPALPAQPGRAVLLGIRTGPIAPLLESACEALGIELRQAGGHDTIVDDLTPELMRADIVFAVGRTLLEGMALGRAGFLIDDRGMGGFVDADSYEAFEAGAFATFDPEPTTVDGLIDRIGQYRPSLGQVGRELVRRHHSARWHACELVETYRTAIDLGPPPKVLLEPLCALASRQADELFGLRQRDRAQQWAVVESERRRADAEVAREALDVTRRMLEAELQRIGETKTMRWSRPLREAYRRLAGPGAD